MKNKVKLLGHIAYAVMRLLFCFWVVTQQKSRPSAGRLPINCSWGSQQRSVLSNQQTAALRKIYRSMMNTTTKQTSSSIYLSTPFFLKPSSLDFIEFEREAVAAILGSQIGNGQSAPAQQIDIVKVRVTRRQIKLQRVPREQFRIQATGDGVVSLISSSAQCFHRLGADKRERGSSVHEEKNVDERQRLLGTGAGIVASTTHTSSSTRKVHQESLVVANNASVHFSLLLVARQLLVLRQARKILYFKKGGEVTNQVFRGDIGHKNVELAGCQIIGIVHYDYRF